MPCGEMKNGPIASEPYQLLCNKKITMTHHTVGMRGVGVNTEKTDTEITDSEFSEALTTLEHRYLLTY
jgi:hypothetical protein